MVPQLNLSGTLFLCDNHSDNWHFLDPTPKANQSQKAYMFATDYSTYQTSLELFRKSGKKDPSLSSFNTLMAPGSHCLAGSICFGIKDFHATVPSLWQGRFMRTIKLPLLEGFLCALSDYLSGRVLERSFWFFYSMGSNINFLLYYPSSFCHFF